MVVFASECNRSSVVTALFPNDVSSKNEVERRRQEKEQVMLDAQNAEVTAKCIESERVAREEVVREQLQEANDLIERLERDKTRLMKDLKTQSDEVSRKKQELTDVNEKHKASMDQETEKLKVEQAKVKEFENTKLEPDNDLPLHFHAKMVNIVNSSSKTSIDMGRDSGGTMHGWRHDWGYQWQQLYLEKVDPRDPKSNWLISCSSSGSKRYLSFRSNDNNSWPNCDFRESSWEGQRQQEWQIGSVDGNRTGKWMIKNVRWNCYLDLQEEAEFKDGAKYRPSSRNTTWSSQNFYILHHFRGTSC